jgi:hypothetical protein
MRKINMFAATLCIGLANVRRFLRLYWATYSRPWFNAYVEGGRNDRWDGDACVKKVRAR